MPSRHRDQTIYCIGSRYYSMVGPHPDQLRLDSTFRAACDEIEHYQGGRSRGYVMDAMWRVEQDRFATEQEVQRLTSTDVRSNPLGLFGQFRVISLAQCGGEHLKYRPKHRLHYLWWVSRVTAR